MKCLALFARKKVVTLLPYHLKKNINHFMGIILSAIHNNVLEFNVTISLYTENDTTDCYLLKSIVNNW